MKIETNLEDPAGANETGHESVQHAISRTASAALLGVGKTFLLEMFQAVLVF